MKIAPKATWGLGSVGVLALAAAWWLIAPPTPSSSGGDDREQAQAADDVAAEQARTAIAQIAAESATGSIERDSHERGEAPPGFVPVDAANDAQAKPNLPAGFEVTAFHGEMSKARMTAVDVAELPDSLAEMSWLAGGVDGLVAQAMASGRDWTFGWVAIDPDADFAVLGKRLEEMGAEVLGRSGRLLRARLPGETARLDVIAGLPGVAGLGPTPLAAKLPAPRDPNTSFHAVDGLVPTFVTLMSGDPDGRWRQALTDLGGVVGAFDPAIRMYAANFPSAALETVAAADFVLSVEPVRVVKAAHSTAVPAMGADALRTYDAGSGLFSGIGGGSVPIGVMDSGLNIRHEDIGTGRRSICGANFASFFAFFNREEDQDLWVDSGLHGTHVTGTIAGNGTGGAQHAGMAPLVQDIRFAKVLTSFGAGSMVGILRGMDFLGEETTCGPEVTPALRPLVVNMSLSATFPEWDGKSAGERKLDATVWNNRQVYVVSQSNSGFIAYSNFASAKNSLAVGAVEDGGDVANFSSHGPTGGRPPDATGGGDRGGRVFAARRGPAVGLRRDQRHEHGIARGCRGGRAGDGCGTCVPRTARCRARPVDGQCDPPRRIPGRRDRVPAAQRRWPRSPPASLRPRQGIGSYQRIEPRRGGTAGSAALRWSRWATESTDTATSKSLRGQAGSTS